MDHQARQDGSVRARISFRNDYTEGAHPRLMDALARAGAAQNRGYGLDRHSLRAAALIRDRIGRQDAAVHFFAGGTQTNLTAIAAMLRPHEAVVAPASGHIATHESGAIEASGHKVLTIDCPDGKLTPALIAPRLLEHNSEHMVRPRLVYISNTTEWGAFYTRAELTALSTFCRDRDLYLYVDGARLASALTAPGNDPTLQDVAALTDAFYIGGTKNGALLGEALVIVNPRLQPDFRFIIKQRGAMLAKGMVVGSQFEAFFEDDLYLELARRPNRLAQQLRDVVERAGFAMASNSASNQLFPVLPGALVDRLAERYEFETWAALDGDARIIRLMTSWATTDDDVAAFVREFPAMVQAPTQVDASGADVEQGASTCC